MSSMPSPAARWPRMLVTWTRVPWITGFPKQTFWSIVILGASSFMGSPLPFRFLLLDADPLPDRLGKDFDKMQQDRLDVLEAFRRLSAEFQGLLAGVSDLAAGLAHLGDQGSLIGYQGRLGQGQ